MNSGKLKGVYTNWVNARTLAGEKLKEEDSDLVFVCVFLCCCTCFLKKYMTPLKITVFKTLRKAAQFY